MRSIFISDTHLGTRYCQYEKLLNFLIHIDHNEPKLEYIYLVGDIIDIEQLDIKLLMTKHQKIIKKIFQMSKYKTIIYVPGNHDMYFRNEFNDEYINNIQIKKECFHTTVNGDTFIVTHGDKYDYIINSNTIIYTIGDKAYHLLYQISWFISYVRNVLGYKKDFSLAYHIKNNVKHAIQFISRFKTWVVRDVVTNQAHGIICGHIHKAEISTIDNIKYINCGCWTEPGYETFIGENKFGELILYNYNEYITNENFNRN